MGFRCGALLSVVSNWQRIVWRYFVGDSGGNLRKAKCSTLILRVNFRVAEFRVAAVML